MRVAKHPWWVIGTIMTLFAGILGLVLLTQTSDSVDDEAAVTIIDDPSTSSSSTTTDASATATSGSTTETTDVGSTDETVVDTSGEWEPEPGPGILPGEYASSSCPDAFNDAPPPTPPPPSEGEGGPVFVSPSRLRVSTSTGGYAGTGGVGTSSAVVQVGETMDVVAEFTRGSSPPSSDGTIIWWLDDTGVGSLEVADCTAVYHAPDSLGGPDETWFNLEIETDYGVVTLPVVVTDPYGSTPDETDDDGTGDVGCSTGAVTVTVTYAGIDDIVIQGLGMWDADGASSVYLGELPIGVYSAWVTTLDDDVLEQTINIGCGTNDVIWR